MKPASYDSRSSPAAPRIAAAALTFETNSLSRAIRDAPAIGKPVVFSDGADSVSACATGDGVEILRPLIDDPVPGPCLAVVADAPAAQTCVAAGVGAAVTVQVGGSLAGTFHTPVTVTGIVTTVCDRRYQSVYPPVLADVGSTAVLVINERIHPVITTHPGNQLDYRLYLRVGLDPAAARLVVAKSAGGYKAFCGPIAAACVDIDTTGPGGFERLLFTRPGRPLWPFDAGLAKPW